jgi:hypothetical protein
VLQGLAPNRELSDTAYRNHWLEAASKLLHSCSLLQASAFNGVPVESQLACMQPSWQCRLVLTIQAGLQSSALERVQPTMHDGSRQQALSPKRHTLLAGSDC